MRAQRHFWAAACSAKYLVSTPPRESSFFRRLEPKFTNSGDTAADDPREFEKRKREGARHIARFKALI